MNRREREQQAKDAWSQLQGEGWSVVAEEAVTTEEERTNVEAEQGRTRRCQPKEKRVVYFRRSLCGSEPKCRNPRKRNRPIAKRKHEVRTLKYGCSEEENVSKRCLFWFLEGM